MKITDALDSVSAQYQVSEHSPTFTAQKMAQEEHVHGMNVAKPVIVKSQGLNYMCVLPACCKIDFDALKSILGSDQIELVEETSLQEIFPDCEIGAEPPFGSFYGIATVMDQKLEQDQYILFQAGTHQRAIKMDLAEYKRIEKPRIASFSYHV